MFSRQFATINVNESPCLHPNNLSIIQNQNRFCFFSSTDIIVSDVKGNSNKIPIPSNYTVYQVLLTTIDNVDIVVSASNISVQFWDSKENIMLSEYFLYSHLGFEDDDDNYFAGIAASNDTIAVG